MITVVQTRNVLESTLRAWSVAMRREGLSAIREGMKRVTRQVILITPPASAGLTGRDAFQQGRNRIARDLRSVLTPVRLKGKRKERWPDAAQAYRERRRFRDSGVGVRVGRGQRAYVSTAKFNALLRDKSARIGRMASGWSAAAGALGVAVPAWVRRHGVGRGQFVQSNAPGRVGMRATNLAPGVPDNVRIELERRIPYAMRYVARGLEANILAVGLKAAAGVGIRTRATAGVVSDFAA